MTNDPAHIAAAQRSDVTKTTPRICSLHVDHSETNRAVGLVLFLGVKVQ